MDWRDCSGRVVREVDISWFRRDIFAVRVFMEEEREDRPRVCSDQFSFVVVEEVRDCGISKSGG